MVASRGGWVVYRTGMSGAGGRLAVCSQAEWDRMAASRPGFHALVRSGIATEGEAERAARDIPAEAAPEPAPPVVTPPPASEPWYRI